MPTTELPKHPLEELSPAEQQLLEKLRGRGVEVVSPKADRKVKPDVLTNIPAPTQEAGVLKASPRVEVPNPRTLEGSAAAPKAAVNLDERLLHDIQETKLVDNTGNPQVDLEAFMNRINNPEEGDLDIKNRLN